MTQRAVFRGFLVCLKRVFFACMLCWFGMIDGAIATGAGPINLDNDTYRLVTPAYTNTPDTGIYCTGSSCYFCYYDSYGNCGGQPGGAYYIRPVPTSPQFTSVSHVTVPNNDSFMGWYETSTGLQCINAYGELTTVGMGRVYYYYGADMLGATNPLTWYAYYAPSGIKLVAPEAAPGGRRGKEFLHWNDKKLYLNYNATNGAFSDQMTTTTNCIPANDLPQRNGYYFKGYYSQQTGGTEYVHYDSNLGRACVTTAGLNAVNSYTANSGFPKSWYAQWERMKFNVTWDCNDGHSELVSTVEYEYGDDYSGGPTAIPVEGIARAPDLECEEPSGHEFLGWYCSYNETGETEFIVPDSDFSPVTVGNDMVFWGGTHGGEFPLPVHNVNCIAIWQQPYECPNNGEEVDVILDQPAGTELAEQMLNDEGGQSTCNGDPCDIYEDWGSVVIDGMCSSSASAPWSVGTPVDDNGQYCWCQVRGYYPKGENYFIDLSAYMPWVFNDVSYSAALYCEKTDCATECTKDLMSSSGNLREKMFTTTSCQYNVDYNCNGGIGNIASTSVTVGADYQLNSVSGCNAPNGQHIVSSGNDVIGNGWVCRAQHAGSNSGLSNTPDALAAINGIWSAYDNYTCTVNWENDTHDCEPDYYWSDVTNQCEPGYEITLLKGTCLDYDNPIPQKIYTIQNTGVYRDAERTQLMQPQVSGTGGAYNITPPYKAPLEVALDINAPFNPVEQGVRYTTDPASVESPIVQDYRCAFKNPNNSSQIFIDEHGYITEAGFQAAVGLSNDIIWKGGAGYQTYLTPDLSLTGYTFDGWYDNTDGTGNSWARVGAPNHYHGESPLYAHWTPKTYTISYVLNNGTHGANHPESATYDSEFTVSNPTRTGYTFLGWTITGMDGVTHYYSATPIISNDVYQGATTTTLTSLSNITDTHFMNLRSATGTVTFNAQWENDTYLLTYAINAPNGLSINEPSENPVSVNAGQNRPLAAIPTGVGYTCSEWNCVTSPDGNPVSVNNNTISEMPASNVLCTTSCRRNLVGLGWNTDDADNDTTVQNASPISCVYGTVDGIFPIQTPVKHGYTFVGWTISNWASGSQYNFLTLNTSDDGIERWAKAYSNSADYCWYDTNVHGASNVSCTSDTNFDELERYQWKVKFGHGDVYGTSRCSSTLGIDNETGNPLTNAGKYCWCMVTGYKQSNSSTLNGPATEMPWVMRYTGSDTSVCRKNCAAYCSYHTEYTPVFRSVLYGL